MAKVLITAGGTKENIDPVRYIGNYSSGKMGIALADVALALGHEVCVISTVNIENKTYEIKYVHSADDMLQAVMDYFPNYDYLIMSAAVADFKPKSISPQKIKKNGQDVFCLELVKTPDILKEVSKIKKENQIVIGFCAESENLIKNATQKIKNKKLDFIAANDISRADIGFGSDYNEITLISKDGSEKLIKKTSKLEAAKIIFETCVK